MQAIICLKKAKSKKRALWSLREPQHSGKHGKKPLENLGECVVWHAGNVGLPTFGSGVLATHFVSPQDRHSFKKLELPSLCLSTNHRHNSAKLAG